MQHTELYMCSEMKKAVHIFRVQPPVRVASVRASDTGDTPSDGHDLRMCGKLKGGPDPCDSSLGTLVVSLCNAKEDAHQPIAVVSEEIVRYLQRQPHIIITWHGWLRFEGELCFAAEAMSARSNFNGATRTRV